MTRTAPPEVRVGPFRVPAGTSGASLERERRLTPPRCVDHVDPLHPLHPPETAPARRNQPHRRSVPVRERLPGGGRRQKEAPRVAEREAPAVTGAGDDVDAAVLGQLLVGHLAEQPVETYAGPVLRRVPAAGAVEDGAD